MKIKISELKSIILEEIALYALDNGSCDLLVEASLQESEELIKKIEKLYYDKFGKKMEPPSEMEKERAKKEMEKEGTYLLWQQPDNINKFRWIASHYIMGTGVDEFAEGDIEHFAKILRIIGSKRFHGLLTGIAGTMIQLFPWHKPHTPKDRTKVYPIPNFLKDFSDRVYDKYEELQKQKKSSHLDLYSTQAMQAPDFDDREGTKI